MTESSPALNFNVQNTAPEAAFLEDRGKKAETPGKNFEQELEARKKKILDALKNGRSWISYIALVFLVWLGAYIRTRNLSGLKDVTTGSWTLGPDLDPFLFLRYAKSIVAQGSLMAVDMMRNVPLGFNAADETKLLPYFIAYLYKVLVLLQGALPFQDVTVDLAGVLYPVVMFALTAIVFFFFVKEIFYEKPYADAIALAATLFLVVSPTLLSRTIAGIPEKESSIFFLFAGFYFLLKAWRQKNIALGIFFGILAGVMSMLMGLIWGGVVYLYLTIGLAVLLAFLIGKINTFQATAYASWLLSFNILLFLFTAKYSLRSFLFSPLPSLMYLNLALILIRYGLELPRFSVHVKKYTKKVPIEFIALGIGIVLAFIALVFFLGPRGILEKADDLVVIFTSPIRNRFGLTVAENRQPYFGEWRGSFGPDFKGVPLFFWLFFIGAVALFYHAVSRLETKKGMMLTGLYTLMLFGIIFSRYDSSSTFNGLNFASKLAYFGSVLLFLGVAGYYYIKDYREGKKEFATISFHHILLMAFFFVSLASARSAVRLIMMVVPSAAILVGFLLGYLYFMHREYTGEKAVKAGVLIVLVLVAVAAGYTAYAQYQASKGSAGGFVPSAYTQQWQKAMKWVRDTTPKNAVFSHWWDYGYWVQSIGERATVLDGGNFIVYWDHLMGRHVLTGSDLNNSLTFLYTHNSTHLLIDSTDIGKYGAYASIGGDERNDRASFIPTLVRDEVKTFETRNETVYVYPSGIGLDEDIIWEENGTKNIFSAGSDGIAGIFIKVGKNSSELKQPEAVIFHQNAQIRVPLKYLYYNNTLTTFPSGIDAGIMVVPRLIPQGNGVSVDPFGAVLYFSKRTVHSFVARLYLFNEKNDAFTLVHSEPNLLIENLRQQGLPLGDFVVYGDILGPIKIWEIHYPDGIKANPAWLESDFPSKDLYAVG